MQAKDPIVDVAAGFILARLLFEVGQSTVAAGGKSARWPILHMMAVCGKMKRSPYLSAMGFIPASAPI